MQIMQQHARGRGTAAARGKKARSGAGMSLKEGLELSAASGGVAQGPKEAYELVASAALEAAEERSAGLLEENEQLRRTAKELQASVAAFLSKNESPEDDEDGESPADDDTFENDQDAVGPDGVILPCDSIAGMLESSAFEIPAHVLCERLKVLQKSIEKLNEQAPANATKAKCSTSCKEVEQHASVTELQENLRRAKDIIAEQDQLLRVAVGFDGAQSSGAQVDPEDLQAIADEKNILQKLEQKLETQRIEVQKAAERLDQDRMDFEKERFVIRTKSSSSIARARRLSGSRLVAPMPATPTTKSLLEKIPGFTFAADENKNEVSGNV